MSSVKQTIEIIVSPTGETTVQTKGVTGSACRNASRFIEQALGQKTGERFTSEFYQVQSVEQQARQQN
jgi:hypothetical protein